MFNACERTLTEFECKILSSDFSSGKIEAKRGGGLLSYGHNISISVKAGNNGKIKISVSSNSVGIQIIDWGTNSENENKLIELISNSIK